MHFVEAKGILSAKNGMNLYRGCSHGCIYCDSRSRCYQMPHAFTDIEVKSNAAELLEDALRRRRRKCMIGTGAMTDPYIPLEMELGHTRACLELIEKYGFGAALHTKSDRILRDLDILTRINSKTKCVVQTTLTTYDEKLCKIVEPNVATSKQRFEMLKVMRDHGIPTVVWISPILPYINDTEENLRGLLHYCIEAKVQGVLCFGMGLTLRDGNREYFYQQLDRHFPGLKERYMREYGNAYQVNSRQNRHLMRMLRETCEAEGILWDVERVFAYLTEFEDKEAKQQLSFLPDMEL
ncbi:radical SAM protein [Anaerovorax odorimutans]|uniref:Radical SAM protein n=1 Tax=Anaerovorax odorimutans TaxID=109327 RepID=A0ABT1RQ46_9FIRM|nr:radical SAM protein [Anaerovorax odorimutans]